jgi:hypothetical protein
MYSDISTLQDKIDLYYLENGVFPSDGTTITKNSKDCVKDGAINPNDGEDYYLVDISKLEGITLNNSKSTDVYYVNKDTHTVYYEKGVQVAGSDSEKKYTLDLSEVTNISVTPGGILESCQ